MTLLTNKNIDAIQMPENLALAMQIMEFRQKCAKLGCAFDYAHFAFGGSPFPIPEAIRQGLIEHSDRGEYLPAVGIEPLRKQIGRFWRHHFNLDIHPDRVVVMPGSKQALFQVMALMQGPVILAKPSWVGYLPIAQLLGKDVFELPTSPETGYRITAQGLRAAAAKIDAAQSMLVLNSPNNPTGAVYSESELQAIAQVCREHGILVISDEIYALITYATEGEGSFTSMAAVYPEGTFVTSGISKYAGAGGYRLGFAILPESCVAEQRLNFQKIGAATYTNASAPVQFAAIGAFGLDEAMNRYIETQRNIHRIMTTELSRRFNELPGVSATIPQGAFYFFADFEELRESLAARDISTGSQLGNALFDHPHRVAMVAGEALIMPAASLTFRVASVDYDGAVAMAAYRDDPPSSTEAERAFFEAYAPRMVLGLERLRHYIDSL